MQEKLKENVEKKSWKKTFKKYKIKFRLNQIKVWKKIDIHANSQWIMN